MENGITVSTLSDEFIDLIEASSTRHAYRQAMGSFRGWLKDSQQDLVTNGVIRQYKFDLAERGLNPKTVSTYLSGLRRYFKHCVDTGVVRENPCIGIKNPKLHSGHTREALTAQEAKLLLNNINRETLGGKRDYAVVYLMLKCGLREIEVVRANVEDLRPKDGSMVLYVQGKAWAGKNDFVVVVDEVNKAIKEYLEARNDCAPKDALFASVGNRSKGRLTTRAIRERINFYLNKAGVKRSTITAHSLRHTAASLALEAGAPIFEVKQMLRHSLIETTMIYLHEYDRIKNGAENYIKQI
jgi:site-specific recombinase XerD